MQLVVALPNLIWKTFAIEMMSICIVHDLTEKDRDVADIFSQTGFFYSTATSILPDTFVFQCINLSQR